MRIPRLLLIGSLFLLAAACGTMSNTPAVAAVNVHAQTAPFFGSGFSAPFPFDVSVTNRTTEPLNVRSIRVSSPGMLQYTIRREEKLFKETLAPGETKALPFTATAIRTSSTLGSTEPLTLRLEVDFERSNGKVIREVYTFPNLVI